MDPEPWSEKDFGSIVVFLRNQIGISLELHRMGLLQARLRSRLQGKGISSFAQFHDQVLKPDPTGWGTQLLIDLSTVNHTSFFREPAHFTFLIEHVAAWLARGPHKPDSNLVGGLFVGPRTVQHGDGPGRGACPTTACRRWRSGAATFRWRCSRSPPGRSTQAETSRGFRRRGSDASSSWAKGRARGRSGSCRRSATSSSSGTSICAHTLWPVPTDFHVIFCRNVSIYFSDEERLALLDRLSQHLRPGGWLVMGNGEILPYVPSMLRKHSPSIFQKEG